MKKRWRKVKAKPGEFKIQYGRDACGEVDLCFAGGEGVSRRDANYLHYRFCSPFYAPGAHVESLSLVKELDSRGYDIKTLKFSIQKKPEGGEG